MKNRKALIIIGIILVAAVAFVGITVVNSKPKMETVKTAQVTKGELKSYLSTNAVVKSKNIENYIGAAQLTVKKVNVKVGDRVKKGQAMIEYDLSDMDTNVQQAQIQYNNAVLQKKELQNQKNQIDDTIEKLDRQIKELESSKNPSDALQLQTVKQKRESIQPISSEKVKLTDNSVALAKLTLDSAKSKLEKYRSGIVADFNGTVTVLNASEGLSISPSQPAVVVQQLDNLKALVSLGKYDAQKVEVGQDVILKNGSKSYKGKVSFINPAAEKSVSVTGQETSLQAEIDILDVTSDLKVDFEVNVDILLGSVKDSLKLPVESIKYDKSGKSFVYTVVDRKAKEVEIKPGIQSDTEVQVVSGLNAGDTVILNPGISIKDGTAVLISEGAQK